MKNKPTAYELEYTGSPNNVIKCECCSFKAVKAQFDECGGCPACAETHNIVKGMNKSENRLIGKNKIKKGV